MESAERVSNDSAQSPACRTKAAPRPASASAALRARASPANTSGGSPRSSSSALASASVSRHSGCWSACRLCQESGRHAVESLMGQRVAPILVRRSSLLPESASAAHGGQGLAEPVPPVGDTDLGPASSAFHERQHPDPSKPSGRLLGAAADQTQVEGADDGGARLLGRHLERAVLELDLERVQPAAKPGGEREAV